MSVPMYDGNHSKAEPYDGLVIRIERLYRVLLQLHIAPHLETALAEVLRLLVDIMGSELAYVEIFGTADRAPYWVAHTNDADVAATVRARVSRDLVGLTITKRKPVEVTLSGERAQRPERTNVLCTPIGGRVPAGVLYVESATWFTTEDRERIAAIAHHLGDLSSMTSNPLPPLRVQMSELKARLVRRAIERHSGNIAEAARELQVARTLIYRMLKHLAKPD